MEVFKKLGIFRSNVAIIKDRQTAIDIASRRNSMVALGDDCKYWICTSNRDASKLMKAGYEVVFWNAI